MLLLSNMSLVFKFYFAGNSLEALMDNFILFWGVGDWPVQVIYCIYFLHTTKMCQCG